MNDFVRPIPGPDPGACPTCGGWLKAGMEHRCEEDKRMADLICWLESNSLDWDAVARAREEMWS